MESKINNQTDATEIARLRETIEKLDRERRDALRSCEMLIGERDALQSHLSDLQNRAVAATRKWFYQSFDDDLMQQMEEHGLIAQAEGFSTSLIAELSLEVEVIFSVPKTAGKPKA